MMKEHEKGAFCRSLFRKGNGERTAVYEDGRADGMMNGMDGMMNGDSGVRRKKSFMSCLKMALVLIFAMQSVFAGEAAEAASGGIVDICLEDEASAALREDGSLWMWGGNQYGQLGIGTNADSGVPEKVMEGVKAVSVCQLLGHHCAALKEDGSLWTWGLNSSGQLGNGNTANSNIPVKVMDDVKTVAVGLNHTAAIKEDGSLWTWGSNYEGQLGNGGTANRNTPGKILEGVSAVSLGFAVCQGAALKEDGSLWVWGNNEYGQLGNTSGTSSSTPVKVMTGVKSFSVGNGYMAAVKQDGGLWLWGHNNYGQVGNGTTTDVSTPVRVMTGVKAVSLGNSCSAALKTDGSLWLWGNNLPGTVGDGTQTNRLVPVKTLEYVKEFSLSVNTAAALKTDGSLWVWGRSQGETTSSGSPTDALTPRRLMAGVKAVRMAFYHNALLKEDGSLWLWGRNNCGQLGNGITTYSYVPVKAENFRTSLTGAVLSVSSSGYVYNGSARRPGVTVTLGSRTLTAGTDYSVSYSNNTNAGTAVITVTGEGDYKGTATTTFSIAKESVKSAEVSLSQSGYTYNGQAKTPSVQVKLGGRTLAAGTDYTVSYSNNTAAGTAAVTITGQENYKDTAAKTFTIAKASVKTAVISLSPASYVYDGQVKTPSVTVTVDGRTLISGTDYVVGYGNNQNAGTASVTVVGTGNYMDSVTKSFTIEAPASSPEETKPSGTTDTPENSAQPAVTPGNGGTAKKDLSGAVIQLTPAACVYNMEYCIPAAVVTLGGITLKENQDYSILYSNNINAGTAAAVISGTGSYTGKKSVTFAVRKADQKISGVNSSYVLKAGDSISLASAMASALLKNSSGSVTLVSEAAKAYTSSDPAVVSVDQNGLMKAVKAGSAAVTITDPGTVNLNAASFTVTVRVEKAGTSGEADGSGKIHISSCGITLKKASYRFTGQSILPEVTVTYNGQTLKAGTDFTVSFLNNINAGQGIVRLTGQGRYTGQKDETFAIQKKAQKITAKNITLVRSSKKQKKKLGVKVLGGAKVTYTPSDKKVKVSKGKVIIPANYVGLCKIKIKASSTQNYSSKSKTIKITVNPPTTSLKGLSISSGKKAFRISWKAVKGVTGYEAQMAQDGKFKKSVEKVKGKAANAEFFYTPGKTYYFRVRTYKKVSGKLYYSKWSKVQSRKAR